MKSKNLVYVTTPDQNTAVQLANGCIKAGLAACANIIPGMVSVYEWQGKIQQSQEAILVLKTNEEAVLDLTHFITSRHPFENPCVIAMPICGGSQNFLEWIEKAVAERRG